MVSQHDLGDKAMYLSIDGYRGERLGEVACLALPWLVVVTSHVRSKPDSLCQRVRLFCSLKEAMRFTGTG